MDANVCVSAVLSAKGNPARVLDHVLEEGSHDFELCAPSQLFSKVEEVLARPKIANRLGWGPARIGLTRAGSEIPKGDREEIPSYTADQRAAEAGETEERINFVGTNASSYLTYEVEFPPETPRSR